MQAHHTQAAAAVAGCEDSAVKQPVICSGVPTAATRLYVTLSSDCVAAWLIRGAPLLGQLFATVLMPVSRCDNLQQVWLLHILLHRLTCLNFIHNLAMQVHHCCIPRDQVHIITKNKPVP